MSLDKAIIHNKEFRKPYRGAKAIDPSCRNHGTDPWDMEDRRYKFVKSEPVYDPNDGYDFEDRTKPRNNFPKESLSDFNINAFARLQGSSTAAGFGERRHYFLNNTKIDEAWHLGLDWASVAQDSITISNGGDVIFKEYLGIYGSFKQISSSFISNYHDIKTEKLL